MVQKHRNTEAILEDYRNGVNIKAIAREWFVHENTVSSIARRHGLPKRTGFQEKRNCIRCGQEYIAERHQRMYCSRQCSDKKGQIVSTKEQENGMPLLQA